MAGHQLMGGFGIAVLTPALGQHEFLLRLEQGKFPDFLEIAAEVALGGEGRRQRGKVGGSTHIAPLSYAVGDVNERLALSLTDC
jgi:hypothetical protein